MSINNLYSFINSNYKNNHLNNYTDIENPATATIIAKAHHASEEDIKSAIESSRQAYIQWRDTATNKKVEILNNIADILYNLNDDLALLEVRDTGKPIKEAINDDIKSAADCFRYYAGFADKIYGQQQQLLSSNSMFYTIKEPLGVCLGIGAWNYPLQIAAWKAAPCLAAGNSMIYKPSLLTPTTSLKLAEIITEAGAPDGLFNVLLGGNELGEQLVLNPDIAKISVTGSVTTGKNIMSSAGKNLTPVTMELGGKSPLIILDDANLDKAAETAVLANFYTQGEICSNGTRVYVSKKIYPEFINKILDYTKKIKIGNPEDINTDMGALISESHLNKVLNYIQTGIKEGAEVLYGGNKYSINNKINNNGYFLEPTIFTNCDDNSTIAREEIFGPVMCVFTFDTIDEVISRANNTTYGLAAGVFSQNISLAHQITNKLHAGTCWINSYNLVPINMPFGGYKNSGIGRENGVDGINNYLQTKSVYLEF